MAESIPSLGRALGVFVLDFTLTVSQLLLVLFLVASFTMGWTTALIGSAIALIVLVVIRFLVV